MCEIAPPLPKEGLRLISSLPRFGFFPLSPAAASTLQAYSSRLEKEEIRSREVTAFLSACSDLSQGATMDVIAASEADSYALHCFAELSGIAA